MLQNCADLGCPAAGGMPLKATVMIDGPWWAASAALPSLLAAMGVCLLLIWWCLWRLARPPGALPVQQDGQLAGAAGADVSHQDITSALRALAEFQTQEVSLRARLSFRARRLAQRRAATLAAMDVVHSKLNAIRLPQTLAALFDSLVAMPGKAFQAQVADVGWHALAGVQPLAIERWSMDHRSGLVAFRLDGETFSLGKQTFEMPNRVVHAFTLCADNGQLLVRVKTCGAPGCPDGGDSVVVACRPGPWVGVFAGLRLRMDERREALLQQICCGDLAQFVGDANPSGGRPGPGAAP